MDTEAQGWWGPRNFDGLNLLRCARVAIVWLLVLTLGACSEPVVTAQHDAGVEEFFQHAQSDKDHVWLEEKASEFIATLPRDTRIAIAERALLHTDPLIQIYGVNQFYELGLTERGDVAAAELVVQGVDLTGMTWAWLHSADRKLLEKRLAGIGEVILSRYDALTPAQQDRAKKLLCDDQADCDIGALAAKQSHKS